jgi:Holliday junction resolvase-like predicted endonuclease
MALAEGGMQVGELAKHYYPGGTEIPYSQDKEASIATTSTLLEQEEVIIYEAAISFEKIYALVDILKKEGNTLHLIEVKSKSWDAHEGFYTKKGAIDKQWHKYLYDVAFQTWVAQKAFPGYHIKPYLMLIDKNKASTIDGLHQYFKVVKDENGRSAIKLSVAAEELELGDPILTTIDCSEEVFMIFEGTCRDPQSELEAQGFEQWVLGLVNHLDREEAYPIEIGAKCKNCEHRVPAAKLEDKTCGFNECWKKALRWSESDLGKPHIFDIWFSPTKKLLRDNIYFMEEVTPTWLAVNETSLYQQPAWDHGRSER